MQRRSASGLPSALSAERLALVAILGLATGLRLWDLGGDSLWIDEIRGLFGQHGQPLLDEVRSTFGPFDPPLSFVLYRLAAALPGSLEATVRLPSVAGGVIEVAATYGAAAELLGRRRPALVAAALVSTAPFAVRYSQEARYHVLLSAVVAAMWWAWLRARRRGGRAWWTWTAIAAIGLWTHILAGLILAVQVVASWTMARVRSSDGTKRGTRSGDRRAARQTTRGAAVALVAFTPWLVFELAWWVFGPGSDKAVRLGPEGLQPAPLGPDMLVRAGSWLLTNAPPVESTLLLVAAVALSVTALSATGLMGRVALGLVAYITAVGLGFWWLSSLASTYFAFRRVEMLVPALLLLVALGVARSAEVAARLIGRQRYEGGIVVALTGALVALSLIATVDHYHQEKTNYRAMADRVDRAPDDALVVMGTFNSLHETEWDPLVRRYVREIGVDRAIVSIEDLDPAKVPSSGAVLWLTGAAPDHASFEVHALNDVDRLQPIAGDSRLGTPVIPAYVLESHYTSRAELGAQIDVARGLGFITEAP